jgi:oligopeptide transport system permease protein
MCSLGSLASDSLNGIYSFPLFLVMPSVLISLIILAFNMVGDGLRDALDPRMKGK